MKSLEHVMFSKLLLYGVAPFPYYSITSTTSIFRSIQTLIEKNYVYKF